MAQTAPEAAERTDRPRSTSRLPACETRSACDERAPAGSRQEVTNESCSAARACPRAPRRAPPPAAAVDERWQLLRMCAVPLVVYFVLIGVWHHVRALLPSGEEAP